jgi:predicted nucleic acid-binding protein
MHLVLDASVVVEITAGFGPGPYQLRRWVEEHSTASTRWVVHTHTFLEVTSALRRLERGQLIESRFAELVIDNLAGFPALRATVGMTELRRIWELRNNIGPYDAVYVAAAEALAALHGDDDAALVTADGGVARSGVTRCRVLHHPKDTA